jgi:hypothetical protein
MIMIGSTTRRFTKRFDKVDVVTLSALREHLDSLSNHDCKFDIDKVGRDRVTVRCETQAQGKHASFVVLPAYPTGHADDSPTNPNVVLDPIEFVKADTHEERHKFVPLLGHDVLAHYEKMHPAGGLKMTRCC